MIYTGRICNFLTSAAIIAVKTGEMSGLHLLHVVFGSISRPSVLCEIKNGTIFNLSKENESTCPEFYL
jgi:hypothetical protein